MNEGVMIIFVNLCFWGAVAFIVYMLVSARNRERMALIERGMDASVFYPKSGRRRVSITLRVALLIIGVGSGILFGEFLKTVFRMNPEVSMTACIFLGGGLGLLAAYLIDERKKSNEIDERDEWVAPGPRYHPRKEEEAGPAED